MEVFSTAERTYAKALLNFILNLIPQTSFNKGESFRENKIFVCDSSLDI